MVLWDWWRKLVSVPTQHSFYRLENDLTIQPSSEMIKIGFAIVFPVTVYSIGCSDKKVDPHMGSDSLRHTIIMYMNLKY